MQPDIKNDFDMAYAALGRLEEHWRHGDRFLWWFYPPVVGLNGYSAVDAAMQGSWWWLVSIMCAAVLFYMAQRHEIGRAEVKAFVVRERRHLDWLAKLYDGEEQRRVSVRATRGEEMESSSLFGTLRCFCERHQAAFEAAKVNMPSAVSRLSGAFMASFLQREVLGGEAELRTRVREFEATGQPVCCYLGDKALSDILRTTPASTGDTAADIRAAESETVEPKAYGPDTTH